MSKVEYQDAIERGVEVPQGLRPLTAESFVDWLIEYKSLDPRHKDNVISNLKQDYQRVKLQGALEQSLLHPQVIVEFSIFGKGRNK